MESKRLSLAVMYGLITIFLIAVATSLIFSFLLKFTTLQEGSIAWVVLALSFLALFIGGFVSGGKGKEKGWLLGAATGGLYTMIIFLFQYLGSDSLFTLQQLIYHGAFVGIATLGGIIGVNLTAAKA
ncbi:MULTISPECIES: TIGR04086 family membrane protein [Sutcliffiella]|uniref:TIGR04086 family membrane protein n=1 Tax=Sutcliffiella cohnii TaxID=33932 RepID=A0A223KTN9_9BACI|nr:MULTISPECIES: TIGR04086 family membrane protein [Sutcliffiella]AST92708.1 hypothetical protein BC6307_16140 [Sutcliffiella cohnii]MED4016390.1 TIGR04086 family membrane protein [Sutcliffiella cohnii]WBL13957.1 TIGR04086 family membrane protein [Sutcliffiella sp. NC1]